MRSALGHAEEEKAIPLRAGDLAGDSTQGPEAPAIVLEVGTENSDDDRLILILLDDHAPGHRKTRVMIRHDVRCGGVL